MKKLLVVLMIMSVFCGVALARGYATVISSFSTEPYCTTPSAITYENGNFWISNPLNSTFYKVTTTGSLISTFNISSFSYPYGLTWDGSVLWTHALGSLTQNLYRMNTSGSVVGSYMNAITYPYSNDIEYLDGANLGIWVANSGPERRIYRHSNTTGSIMSSFVTNAKYPCGLAWDGSYLVITGNYDGIIFRYSTSGVQQDYCYPPFSKDDYEGGTVYNGGFLYWVISRDAMVYKISIDWNPQNIEASSLGRIRSLYE